ncbi:MAG: hypothetical protein RIS47_1755 [Bacteroidota bacterium]|jgi:OOP family OmpA-OmpF porin
MAISSKSYKGIDDEEDLKWEELRSLFIGDDSSYLNEVHEFLSNPDKFAKEISKILPRALKIGNEKNIELSHELLEAIKPIIIRAIAESAKSDPEDLSEKLLPILGPAVRKSLNDTFRKMDQSFNTLLLRTFSIKGLQYRIEAWRTGQSFSDIMLSHTLIFRVVEVFLIHRETGLLLHHVTEKSSTNDADMMSAMLKAIQDFARDSFRTDDDADLGSVQFGGSVILLEQDRSLILAAVLIGRETNQIRNTLRDILGRLEARYAELLKDFDGDTDVFEESTEDLKECLLYREKEEHAPKVWRFWASLGVVALLILLFFVPTFVKSYKWNRYIDFIATQPGVVIVENGKQNGKLYAAGMLMPTSPDPKQFYARFGIDSTDVDMHWLYYSPYSPTTVVQKARRVLRAPEGVEFELRSDTLFVLGIATELWVKSAMAKADNIWEISNINFSRLTQVEFEDPDKVASRIQQMFLLFELESSSLTPNEVFKANDLVEEIQNLINIAMFYRRNAIIVINGFADGTGSASFNKTLSEDRAMTVYNFLISKGISPNLIQRIGHGFSKEDDALFGVRDQSLRKVNVTIKFSDK